MQFIDINKPVQEALNNNRPIVALESTIISHGMPYPKNIETAKEVENIVREYGATPATIAIINGRIKVGLSESELEFMGKSTDILKISHRDMAYVISNKLNGATTVASTMMISEMVGIPVFVTGGIGGVHRNAQLTFDISADLTELAKTNVAIVCAGVKSILDIGLTLEYLETSGVPVFSYKETKFPAFFIRKSGFDANYMVNSPEEIANIIKTKWDMGISGGIVIANPIPEEYEMDSETISCAIENALLECKKKKIHGKAITPFVLDKVNEVTSGCSLESNIKLVLNNAKLGAEIACEYSRLT